jgi:hypothetical protein
MGRSVTRETIPESVSLSLRQGVILNALQQPRVIPSDRLKRRHCP